MTPEELEKELFPERALRRKAPEVPAGPMPWPQFLLKVLKGLGFFFGPMIVIGLVGLIGITMWDAMPTWAQNAVLDIVGTAMLVGLIVFFGGWAWEILGQGDEGYPFGRSGRFLHLLIAFAVLAGLGYIALTSLGVF